MSTKWWTESNGDLIKKTQAVIIGSGAGGAFAALTLAEAGMDVILLEAGFQVDMSNMPPKISDSVSTLYEEAGFRSAMGTPPCPIAGGKVLGGSTVINSAICFQTPKASLSHWNELTNGLFPETDWYHRQDDIEQVMRVATTPDGLLSGNDNAHKKAAVALGWEEGNIRRNTPACAGCGRCNVGCSVSGKYSVDREILPRAVAAGATVYTGATVTKVAENSVVGICRLPSGQAIGKIKIDADVVIMAAGSIGTPQLLLESNVAPHNTQIGRGLHIHPVISIWGILPEAVYARGATQGHYVDQFSEDWVLLESNPILLGAFYQGFPLFGQKTKEIMKKAPQMVTTGALVRDTSEGTVGPRQNGTAQIDYKLNDLDRSRLIKGLHAGAELWFDGAKAEIVSPSIFGAKLCRNMDDYRRNVPLDLPAERLTIYSSHPQASCRVGRALDFENKLKGTNSIYVMDASALPSNVGRNPQISVMTFARMQAERLALQLGFTPKPLV